VPKQRLHHPQIGAIVQKMTGECVPQYMRAQAIGSNAACLPKCLELARKVLPGEVALGAEGRKQPFRFGVALGCRA